jgi:hypothetical protein
MLSREATNTNFIVFDLTRSELKPMRPKIKYCLFPQTRPTQIILLSKLSKYYFFFMLIVRCVQVEIDVGALYLRANQDFLNRV